MKQFRNVAKKQDAASLMGTAHLFERLFVYQGAGGDHRRIYTLDPRTNPPARDSCYRFGTAIRFAPEEIRTWLAQYRDTPVEREGR